MEVFIGDADAGVFDADGTILACSNRLQKSVRSLESYPHTRRSTISIKDTGIGIADEDLHKIFAKFGRMKRAVGPGAGTGLGLYLAKK